VTTLDFVVACLATWRVSSLLVREEGPYALLARVRRSLGTTAIGRALECFYCTSLWVAAPIAWWLTGPTRAWAIVWLAVSGAAILAERATTHEVAPHAMELDEAIEAMSVRRG